MNQREYELVAETILKHRETYGGRTDSVALEIAEDLAEAFEFTYDNFDRDKFNDIARKDIE